MILRLCVSVEHRLIATDRQTHDDDVYRASLASRGKNTGRKSQYFLAGLCWASPLTVPMLELLTSIETNETGITTSKLSRSCRCDGPVHSSTSAILHLASAIRQLISDIRQRVCSNRSVVRSFLVIQIATKSTSTARYKYDLSRKSFLLRSLYNFVWFYVFWLYDFSGAFHIRLVCVQLKRYIAELTALPRVGFRRWGRGENGDWMGDEGREWDGWEGTCIEIVWRQNYHAAP